MSVTFEVVQQRFEQIWHDEQKMPIALIISESDYDAFFESLWPSREWTAVEIVMLGTDCIASLDERREHAKQHLSGIINYVNGKMIPLLRDPKQLQGTIQYRWEKTI